MLLLRMVCITHLAIVFAMRHNIYATGIKYKYQILPPQLLNILKFLFGNVNYAVMEYFTKSTGYKKCQNK